MQVEHVDIGELIRRVLVSFESKINAKGLEWADLKDGKVYVLADMNRLTQVLHNIMENAIKFAPEADGCACRTRCTAIRVGEHQQFLATRSRKRTSYILTASTRSTNPIRGKGGRASAFLSSKYPQGTRPEDMGNVERAGRNDLHVYAQKAD